MLVLVSREKLQKFINDEIKCWESIGGGPNINAYAFDPKTTDPNKLRELGYYDNRESWIAGARIKELLELLVDIESTPDYKK